MGMQHLDAVDIQKAICAACHGVKVVLVFVQHLRQAGIAGKFVEFFGPGVSQLSAADRTTIANMCPEYGATVSFFPVDEITLKHFEQTSKHRTVFSFSSPSRQFFQFYLWFSVCLFVF